MPDDSMISFRFSEPEIEALKAHSLPAESLSLTAKRLLRSMLEVTTAKSTESESSALVSVEDIVYNSVDKIVDNHKLDEKIEALLEDRFTSYIASINQKFKEQEERIEILEKLKA